MDIFAKDILILCTLLDSSQYFYSKVNVVFMESICHNFVYFSYQAAPPVFIDKDDQSSRWLNDIAAKNLLEPQSLNDVQGRRTLYVVKGEYQQTRGIRKQTVLLVLTLFS